jgi:hypothetical protein
MPAKDCARRWVKRAADKLRAISCQLSALKNKEVKESEARSRKLRAES